MQLLYKDTLNAATATLLPVRLCALGCDINTDPQLMKQDNLNQVHFR